MISSTLHREKDSESPLTPYFTWSDVWGKPIYQILQVSDVDGAMIGHGHCFHCGRQRLPYTFRVPGRKRGAPSVTPRGLSLVGAAL